MKIRNLQLGEGMPKICVPLTGKNREDILEQAAKILQKQPDIVEWRADCYEGLLDYQKLDEIGKSLRQQMGDCPLLFTCRTEDGSFHIDTATYVELNRRMIYSGAIDLLDAELFMGDQVCRELVEYAHAHHMSVILSNHEFTKTPDVDVMVNRLVQMRQLGADIPKLAVMPKNKQDVLKLLQATNTYNQWYGDGPIITMSMGSMGAVSRLCGETFGSAVTFATVGDASAPGQADIDTVRQVLQAIHKIGDHNE